MVHEGDETQARPFPFGLRRKDAEGEAVDHDVRLVRERSKRTRGRRPVLISGRGIVPRQARDVHGPAPSTQPGDNLPVVPVAAGLRLDIAGDDEMERAARHQLVTLTGPSNAAQATCDSCRATRTTPIPRACSPSSPL